LLDVALVILCAGNSTRFEKICKKQWLRVANEPLWLNVSKRLSSYSNFSKIIVVAHKEELNYMKNFSDDYIFIEGGETRQNSIKNALTKIDTKYVLINDVARACISKRIVLNLLENKEKASCIVPVLDVHDTVIFEQNTINRNEVKLIQTPQLSNTKILKKALETSKEFTDESSAIKEINESVLYIKGSIDSKKITFGDEIKQISCLNKPSNNFFTGIGFDIHSFEDNKEMFLGGVKLPFKYGFKAHSDGDVLIHSIIDALLGAIGAGDIGEFFPDNDEKYKNISSKLLLEYIVNFVYSVGYEIVNIDLTIIAQKPKINSFKTDIKSSVAKLLKLEKQFVNIKATTAEKLGFIGRTEGIAVQSIATLKYYDWTQK